MPAEDGASGPPGAQPALEVGFLAGRAHRSDLRPSIGYHHAIAGPGAAEAAHLPKERVRSALGSRLSR